MATIVCFNMLNQSLAFGAIPWVMIVPERLSSLAVNWSDLIGNDGILNREYQQHWHKNRITGAYWLFRRLWGEHLNGQAVVQRVGAGQLENCRWGGEDDVMEYLTAAGKTTSCMNMRGLLRQHLKAKDGNHDELALRVFDHVQRSTADVFDWSVRGKNIFNLITNRTTTAKNDDVGGACSYQITGAAASYRRRFFEPAGVTDGSSPDLIFLSEYDVHESNNVDSLDYLGDGVKRTFSDAMRAVGYHSILIDSPKHDNANCGLFAKASMFGLPPLQDSGMPSDGDGVGSSNSTSDPVKFTARCGAADEVTAATAVTGNDPPCVAAFDCFEQWHSLNSPSVDSTEMPRADRKSFGVAALNLLDPAAANGCQRVVCVIAHLMTTSRDCDSKVMYPGEVRAHELQTIRDKVSKYIKPTDAVLFCGDFNIDLIQNKQRHVFLGEIPLGPNGKATATEKGIAAPHTLRFDTGYSTDVHEGYDCSGGGNLKLCWTATDGTIRVLFDAFDGINCLESGPGPGADAGQDFLYGSSHNAARVETIDYIWVDEEHFDVVGRSSLVTPMPDGTPDIDNPSDHIPLVVRLNWRSTNAATAAAAAAAAAAATL